MMGRWAQRFATAIENPVAAYGVALGAVAIAASLRALAGLFLPDPPNFMAFYPAVLFATLVAGLRGGLFATAASMVTIWALWAPAATPAQMILFMITASATVLIAKALRVAILRGVAAEERFRIFQEHGLDAFVIFEPVLEGGQPVDFVWVYANPAADRMAPAGTTGLTGRSVLATFPDETGAEMVRRLTRALTMEKPDDVEVRRLIDGGERFFRSSAVRLTDGIAVTFRDVTAQRTSEIALRAGEARVRALVDSLPQLIWSNRADGFCDYLSPQWEAFTGAPAAEHHGQGWLTVVHPEDREGVTEAWTQAIRGGLPYDIEYRLRRADGVYRWFKGRASALRDQDGVIRRWFGASSDITEIVEARTDLEARVAERTRELQESLEERARTEAALAQAQRLETVGRLTGGVAHDFNNLLTVVIGGLDMILRRPDDEARVRRLAEAALAAGRRGERLTRQLLVFSRRQELKLEVIDLAELIEQVEPLIRRAVGEGVSLTVRRQPGVGMSRIDPAQFEAALLNLVVNAVDAVGSARDGGVEITTARVRVAEGEVLGATPGDYIRLGVADTGSGMAPEIAEHAFEPFFTTKEVGKGTGLGLAQVYGFIKQAGGAVTLESNVGQGTTVFLYLPAAEPGAQAEPAATRTPEGDWARGVRVLLVEDDAAVRAVTEGLLSDLGCVVETEQDGRAALARLDRGERFDLLFSDIVMPGGVSGADLARGARSRDPRLPIVLTTGYAGDRLEGASDDDPWPVLRKPFRAEQLSAVVRDALGAAREPA